MCEREHDRYCDVMKTSSPEWVQEELGILGVIRERMGWET